MKTCIKILFLLVFVSKLNPLFAQEVFTQNYENDNLYIKTAEKKVVFYNIIGTERDLFKLNIKVKLPEGFRLLTNTAKIDSIKLGELRKLFFTVTTEPTTSHGKYPIELQVLEKDTVLTKYTLYFNLEKNRVLEVIPLEKPDMLSQTAQKELSFLVKNTGNTQETIKLSSRSGRLLGDQKITLLGGESQVVKTINNLPISNQSVQLVSFDLTCHLEEIEKPFVSLYTVPIMSFATIKNDPYQRFPIKASIVYNRFSSSIENIGAVSFDITGKGYVDSKNKHLVEFIARGPNRFSIPRFGSIDQYFLSYMNSKWKFEIGDNLYAVSNIIENGRFAKGLNIKRVFGNNEASVFYIKPRFIDAIKEEYGSIFTHRFNDTFKSSAIYMHKDHFLGERIGERNLQTDFLSVYSELERPRYQAKGELGLSKTGNLISLGAFYNSSLNYRKMKMFTNGLFAGKNYFGFYNNSLQINNSLIYHISKKVSVGYSKNISQLNPSLDSFYFTVSPFIDNNNLNVNFDLNKSNKIRFNLISGSREDKMEQKTYHYKEQLLRYFYELKFKKFNFRFDGDLGKSLNLLATPDLQKYKNVQRYRAFAGIHTRRNFFISAFLENLNTTRFSAVTNNSMFWFYGINTQMRIKNSLNFNLNYRNNFAPDELFQSQSLLDASLSLTVKNHEFSITSSYGFIPPPINDKNLFVTFKYTVNINAPFRKKKGLGRVSGQLSGIKTAGVMLNMNGKNVLTDSQGYFAFNDLVPGKYYLGNTKSSLGFGNIMDSEMPYLVEVLPNEKKNINLEVINTGKIVGEVSVVSKDEKHIENIVVELYKDGFSKFTTTNKLGGFQFSELREGEYKIRIVSENIKKQYIIKNSIVDLKVSRGEETLYTFEIEEKKKKVNFQKERIILSEI